MEVGTLEESITVVGESPILQTDRADTGRILESKIVTDMPLTFNRNFQSALILVPGTTRPHREHSAFFNSQDSLAVEVNGQPRLANNTMIEGLDNNHKTGLLQVIIPAADALETVSVSTSNYDAEFGRSGGAVTNVTLKSGTNQVKGSVFTFGNTDATNASDYFTHLKAPTKFLNAGFTVGGPIVRNKFFFFGDYQRTIDNFGYVVRATVPTMAMRNGDFSAVTQRIYDPLTGDPATGNNRTPFDNNIIPSNRISPIARQLLEFVPAPNIAGAPLGQANFQQAQTREKTTDGFDTKLNYSASAKDQFSVRLSFMRPVVFDPGAFGEYGGPANDGFAGTGTNKSISTAMTWTRTLTNTTLLDVRGGLNYYHNVALSQGANLNTSAEVGIPGANLDDYTSGLTRFEIGGYTNPTLGFSPSLPWDRSEKTWNIATTLTQVRGHAHAQSRRRVAQEQGRPAADAGRRRPARPFPVQRGRNRIAGGSGLAHRHRELARRVPARLAEQRRARPEGDRPTRHEALGDGGLHPRQVAGAAQPHGRPRPPMGVLRPARRH